MVQLKALDEDARSDPRHRGVFPTERDVGSRVLRDVFPLHVQICQLVEMSRRDDGADWNTGLGDAAVTIDLACELRAVGGLLARAPARLDLVRLRQIEGTRPHQEVSMFRADTLESDDSPVVVDVAQHFLDKSTGDPCARDRVDANEIRMNDSHVTGSSHQVEGLLHRDESFGPSARTGHEDHITGVKLTVHGVQLVQERILLAPHVGSEYRVLLLRNSVERGHGVQSAVRQCPQLRK